MTLIHRRDALRAEKILQNRLLANDKIEVAWDSVVEEVLGDADPPTVTGLRLKNVKTGAASELAVDGCSSPSATIRRPSCSRASSIWTTRATSSPRPDSTATSIPGVFAAGDVQDKVFRQAVTAAGTGLHGRARGREVLAETRSRAEAAE